MERFEDGAEMGATRGVDSGAFGSGEFIGREVATALAHPDERAVVEHEVIGEKGLGFAKAGGEEPPETFSADLAAGAGEAGDGAFGVLGEGDINGRVDTQPVAHGGDLAEGHAALGHTERAGVHSKEYDTLGAGSVAGEIGGVRFPSVAERIVGVGDRQGEAEAVNGIAQGSRVGDES